MGGGGEGQSGEPETVLDRSAECAALFAGRNRSLLAEDALAGLTVGVYQHSTVARDMMVDVQLLRRLGSYARALGNLHPGGYRSRLGPERSFPAKMVGSIGRMSWRERVLHFV